ncbi:uncharacterized protein TA09250 [Theileria annulata]|uniref:Uncharacterized protein n=1 Tax=Theileria annulata TaxID=5874 RepID=Q4UAF7_THEAN|nr:uncharacterized protein TA09250 [Theileria annulata]CAI76194.1 hypothetical protein TA09250 [Theileria annulata]|eukprot:XP_952819.1 hypothetical protein TA09250 [Theileria annulata]
MVDKSAHSGLGKSLSKIKTSLSNRFKKPESLGNPNPKTYKSGFDITESEILTKSNNAFIGSGNNIEHQSGSSSILPTFENLRLKSNYESHNSYNMENLEKDELDRICNDYKDKYGTDFLDVGLQTYIEAVIDTKNFRNRCYQILSKKLNYLNKYNNRIMPLNHRNDSQSNTPINNLFPKLYQSSETDSVKDVFQTHNISSCSIHKSTQHGTYSDVNLHSRDRTNSLDKPESVYHSANPLGNVSDFSEKCSYDNLLTPQKVYNSNNDLSSFINKYNYLNSSSTKKLYVGGNSDSCRFDDENSEIDTDHAILSYNQKLELLKRMGIGNDYIANKLCDKFDSTFNSNELKDIKEFNLFYKQNLKHQLDLNQQLSLDFLQ